MEIESPGSAALTSALVVKHVERRPDHRKQELGPFPFTVAPRSKTVVRFTDAFPLDAVGGAAFAVNSARPYTLESGRTCTIDGGQLE